MTARRRVRAEGAPPLLIAHRTAMGVRPENTLAGVEAAIGAGADGVEVDVRATSDGAPVLMHDASLARTTGDPRPVAAVTLAGLRALRVADPHGGAGPQPVPTLAEALAASAPLQFAIEVKQAGVEDAVARAVREAGAAARCWLWSFDAEVCLACREALPEAAASLLVGEGADARAAIARAADLGLAGVGLERRLAGAAVVREAHGAGLAVAAWTVNDEAEARRIRAAGADAVCTDDPARLARAVRGP